MCPPERPSCEGRVGSEGAACAGAGASVGQAQRTLEARGGTEECMTDRQRVINYAGCREQSNSVNIGSGAERTGGGGGGSFPSGYASRFITVTILSRNVLPEGQICFYVQVRKNSS